jgi:hypothetical protein
MPKIAAGFWQLVAGSLYILLVLSLFVEHQYVIRKTEGLMAKSFHLHAG